MDKLSEEGVLNIEYIFSVHISQSCFICPSNPSCFTLRYPQRVCRASSNTLFHTRSFSHFTHSHVEAAKYNHCLCFPRPLDYFNQDFTFFPVILYFQTVIRFGRRDAGGEREQRRRPSGQTEEEVPQPVHPQDQQHRAGALWSAERHAGGTGEDSLIYKNTRKKCGESTSIVGSVNYTPPMSVIISLLSCCPCLHP